MISRVFNLILRFAQFVCAVVVLGINGYFLHVYHHTRQGPIHREIYIEVIAGVATIASLVLMLPFTYKILYYPFDFIISAGWFAAFALQVNQIYNTKCGAIFYWGGIQHSGYCNQWKAAEAFSFMSAIFWLSSCILGVYIFHKDRHRDLATSDAPR
jgi:hypothetical protein